MPIYAEVVHASPEKVWAALIEMSKWGERERILASAEPEEGRPGDVGFRVLYHAGRRAWKETTTEVEPQRRLVVAQRREPGGDQAATLEWRMQPSQAGTLLVLEVRGKNWFHSKILHYSRGRWHRRLVRAVKRRAQPKPREEERVVAEPPDGAESRKSRGRRSKKSDAT